MAHGYKPVGGLYPQNSVGWYRKSFSIAKSDSGKRFSIQFDGVFRDAMVWLNGFYLGNNKSGYIGVSYDISDYIDFHRKNVLVVRVDATQYEGWFYEGAGIYRHVWLNEYNNLHIAENGVFVHSKVDGNNASVTVEATIDNETYSPTACSVQSMIIDRRGNKLAQSKEILLTLGLNGKNTIKHELIVKSPRLWSLDDPYLYKVVTIVKKGEVEIDKVINRFGIRTITIDAEKGLFLNGQRIKIQGVNCHQDHAGVGSALPDYLQYYRIKLLKDLGVNAYRTSHNAPTPELLEACVRNIWGNWKE
jgi:beta-galactosidase